MTTPRGREGCWEETPVVAAQPARLEETARLLAEWQGEARAERRRAWLARNPDGPALSWIVDAKDGRGIAATTSVFPRRFTVEGRDAVGSIGGDAYVRPAFRRRGIARALHRAVRDGMAARGVSFMYGPPVPANLAALVAEGARVVGRLVHYALPLTGKALADRALSGANPAARRAAGIAAAAGLAAERALLSVRGAPDLVALSGVGVEFDALWAEARRWHRVAAVRDAAFVRWRHVEAPKPSALFGLVRGGSLRGFVATARIGDRLVVLDILAASEEDVSPLVGGVVRLALSLGLSSVGTRLNPGTAYGRAFRRRGFVAGHDRPAFQMLAPDPPLALLEAGSWHLTYGDEDMDDPEAFLAAPLAPPASSSARERRILYLVDTYWNPHGGTEGQLATLIEHLPRRWRPEMWVIHHSPWLLANRFPCPSRSWEIRSLRRLAYVPRLLSLSRALSARRFDLVQTFMGDAGLVGPVAARPSRTPVLVSRRDLGFWHTPLVAAAQRRTGRLAAGFVTNSRAVAAHVAEAEHVPAAEISVVRNGHRSEPFDAPADPGLRARLSIPAGAPIVGLLANLKSLKRQGDLVLAASRLSKRFPDVHVLLVGGGPADDILATARECGMEGRLRILHATDGVVPILKNLAAGVLCSESEGLSNAILEYMGSSLPVVASDVGGNPELVTDGVNGFLYPVGDVSALAAAIGHVLDDPAHAAEMGRASRRRFEEEFGVRRMLDETVELYDRTAVRTGSRTRSPRSIRATPDLRWETVRHLESLRALASEWRLLLSPRGFFVSPEWVLSWLGWAAEEAKPEVLVAREADGRLAGLLPLARTGLGLLEIAGARLGADHLDVVAAPGREEAVAEGALDRLLGARWLRLRLRHLSEDGALRLAIRRRGWRIPYTESFATTCPYVETAGGFDAYLARFSAKHRGNLKRQVRTFRAAEGAEVVRVLDPTACGAAVEALFALHATRFGERGLSSSFAGPRLRDFHATLARTLAERGDLALTFLRVKGRDVAVHYGFRQGGRLWHFQGGFDPSTDVASPGATLLMIVLEEDVFRAGLSEYDFLDGAEAYKGAFATGVRRLFDVDLYRPSRVGRAAALAKGALGAAKSALKAGLLRGRRKG